MGYTEKETMYPKKWGQGQREKGEGGKKTNRRQWGAPQGRRGLTASSADVQSGTRKGAVLLQSTHPFLRRQWLSRGGT